MSLPLRVLLVEDSEADAALLIHELRRGGYEPVSERVVDAPSMRAALQRQAWDLVISDFALPQFDPLSALALLKEYSPDLPFIIVSGTIGEATAVEALKAGAHDFMVKGSLARLIPAVRRELREAEVRRAHRLAEDELRRLATFPQLSPMPIIEIDLQGRITYLNPTTTRRFPDLPTAGFAHPLLSGMPDVVDQLRTGDKEYIVREVEIGQTAYEEHIWYVPESHLIRIYALNITQRKQAEVRLQREAARSEALAHFAARLNDRLDLEGLLQVACEATAQALRVPVAGVFLHDARRDAFYCAALAGLPASYCGRLQRLLRTHPDADRPDKRLPNLIRDIRALADLPGAEMYAELDIRSAASASMLHDAQLIGDLSIFSVGEVRHFTEDELELLQGLADQAVQAVLNARLFSETERRLQHLNALRTIDTAITGSLDLRVTLNVLLDQALHQLRVDAAAVLLLDAHMQTLAFAAGSGFRTKAIARSDLRLGEGYAGLAALERHTLLVPQVAEASGFVRRAMLEKEGVVTYCVTPLIAKGQVKGVLEIFNRTPLATDAEWMDFLETIARQAAIAIENATLFEGLQRSNIELALAYDTTLEGWSRALDLRDRETEGHTRRVTEMTLRLARSMGVSDAELVHVRRGALLHDIGKMGIPDSILLKPGPLTKKEWQVMRRHPEYAFEMLSPIPFLRPALEIPYFHHEKWDGSGYPRGLHGEQIPLAARIFASADVWDALRSDRPYRRAWPEEKVRAYLRAKAGQHFDPEVLEILLKREIM